MKPWLRFGIALSFIGVLGGCGSTDSSGPDFEDTFVVSDAVDFGGQIFQFAEYEMERMHWGLPTVQQFFAPALSGVQRVARGPASHRSRLPQPVAGTSVAAYLSVLQAAAPGCSISGHGADGDAYNPYDGNGNDVPDDYLLKIDCASVDSIGEGVTVAYTEGVELSIKERTDLLWGWDGSIRNWYSDKQSDEQDHDAGETKVTEHLAVAARRAEFRTDHHFWEKGLDGVVPYNSDAGDELKMVYIPLENDIEFHSIFPPGGVTLSGRVFHFDSSDTDPSQDWRFSTTEPLAFSPDCALDIEQPFVAGSIRALLNGNSTQGFILTSGSCGSGWDLTEIFGDEHPAPVAMPQRAPKFSFPKR